MGLISTIGGAEVGHSGQTVVSGHSNNLFNISEWYFLMEHFFFGLKDWDKVKKKSKLNFHCYLLFIHVIAMIDDSFEMMRIIFDCVLGF